jgi:hypothetical protein
LGVGSGMGPAKAHDESIKAPIKRMIPKYVGTFRMFLLLSNILTGIAHMHLTEILLLSTSPIIQRFHLNFNKIPLKLRDFLK